MNEAFHKSIASLGGHGILHTEDLADLSEATAKIYYHMRDGKWHTIDELKELTGQAQADRRMRSLRGFGVRIECRRRQGSRLFEYRMIGASPCALPMIKPVTKPTDRAAAIRKAKEQLFKKAPASPYHHT